ncbi:MAG: ATP-binding protein, partial [Promethearchaeota archaeon]
MSSSNISALIIGRAKGPAESTYEFSLITNNRFKIKIGELLYYYWQDPSNEKHKVLCRVTSIEPVRLFPDEMLSDPEIDPRDLSEMIDYSPDTLEIYEIYVQIIGYYKDEKFKFVNPRSLPDPGQPIYLAEKEDLVKWINPREKTKPGSAFVGYLLSRLEEKIPIVLDVKSFVSTHLAILAATGQGKSYLVGVILEELLMGKNRGAIMVFDPHGEYTNFISAEDDDFFKGNEVDDGYHPVVNVYQPNQIKIRFSELSFSEIARLLEGLSDKMLNLFRRVYNKVEDNSPNGIVTLSNIKAEIEDIIESGTAGRDLSSYYGLSWRLDEFISSRKIISDSEHITLQEILQPGQLTVFNLSEMEERDQQVVASVFLNRVLRSRIRSVKGIIGSDDPDYLPYPVFIVLEEGHRFAPAMDSTTSKQILKTILSEGRKFGVGICLVSQ